MLAPPYCNLKNRPVEYQYDSRTTIPTGVRVLRPPLTPEQADECDPEQSPECSVIYEVNLSPEWTTGENCNDLGMLPPHGRNQKLCYARDKEGNSVNGLSQVENDFWYAKRGSLRDYTTHPFPDNPNKQSVAAGANAHTSLMEPTKNCYKQDTDWRGLTDDENPFNNKCAFPLGFMSDTIIKHKAICVKVKGAEGRWVEIMAASASGSNGGSFCASDWGSAGEEQACTKEGDLYECREAGRSQVKEGSAHEMHIKFQAFDNIDDAEMGIHWRIVASKLPEGQTGKGKEEKDAEDWCQFRDAADFPMSLMGAYPKNFAGNPVFDVEESSASGLASVLAAVAVAVAAALAL